jgi:quercetin dioxygenase-like cupin family protein
MVTDTLVWEHLPESVVHGNIRRRTFGTERLTLIRYAFPPHAVFPSHTHPDPQVSLVLEGTFAFHYVDRVTLHEPGAIVSIPGGVPHEGRAGDRGAVILCLFAPPRQEPSIA